MLGIGLINSPYRAKNQTKWSILNRTCPFNKDQRLPPLIESGIQTSDKSPYKNMRNRTDTFRESVITLTIPYFAFGRLAP